MRRPWFESLADALIGFLDPPYRSFQSAHGWRNLKVWFGDGRHEHYEVQFLGRTRLEVGFHVEYPDAERSQRALDDVLRTEKRWRKALGREAESGAFLGQKSGPWRRLSEVWDGPGLDSDEAAIEAAQRLAEYVHALEPVRRAAASKR